MQRCMPGQKAAHLITHFQTNEVANIAIKEGIVIVGKRVWARWMQKEPRRCLKCQLLTARHLQTNAISKWYVVDVARTTKWHNASKLTGIPSGV